MDGHGVPEILEAILGVFPLDQYVEKPVSLMERVPGDNAEIKVNLENLELDEKEKGTSIALLKGMLNGLQGIGYAIGGFNAYITSDVAVGSGLSSSATFEVLIGNIISGLFNDMLISSVQIAIMGQYAENIKYIVLSMMD